MDNWILIGKLRIKEEETFFQCDVRLLLCCYLLAAYWLSIRISREQRWLFRLLACIKPSNHRHCISSRRQLYLICCWRWLTFLDSNIQYKGRNFGWNHTKYLAVFLLFKLSLKALMMNRSPLHSIPVPSWDLKCAIIIADP